MPKRKPSKPPRNFVSYFTLCQTIGGELEEAGHRICLDAVHAPAMHRLMIQELERVKRFCERGIAAINAAQERWEGTDHA